MSEAEARKKARELQEEARKRRKEKDEALERERQMEQMKGGKALAEAKEKLEEARIVREAEKRRKEKLEDARALREMEDQLRRDKEERFGKKFTSTGKAAKTEDEKMPIQKAQIGVKMIKELYPEGNYPEVSANCFIMLKAYLTNLSKDPTNEKFRQINKENKMFKDRVGGVQGGIFFLKAVGFVDEGSKLVIDKVDTELIKAAVKLLE